MWGTVATNSGALMILIWALIGVLVVALLATVPGYNRFVRQRTTLDAVTVARSQTMAEPGPLKSLLAVSEAYPDREASTGFGGRQYFQIDEAVYRPAPSVGFDDGPAVSTQADGPHPA
jgi:hypothetical protein